MNEHSNINDPSETARAIFAAQEAGRWFDVAASIHPDTAADAKRYAALLSLEEEQRRANELSSVKEDEMKDRPYWYRQWYGVSSTEELQKLSPQDVLARVAENESPTSPRVRSMLSLSGSAGAVTRREVLGHVMESPDTAHVVFRRKRKQDDGPETVFIELLTLKLLGDQWFAVGTGHLPGFWQQYDPVADQLR